MEPLFLPSEQVSVTPVRRHFRFKQPAGTSRGVYLDRTVWYVVVSRRRPGQPPAIGIGECALLPDLSCDAVPGYEDVLRRACDALRRTGLIDREALRPYPSILFGLETAALSFLASLHTGDCLRLFDTPFSRGEQGIPINGLVWMGSFDEMQARLEAKLAEGSRCVKLKIGAIRFDDELALIRHVRRRFSPADVELRVDANGGFTPEEAPRRLEQLAAYGIHSIEQPIRAGRWAEMGRLCRTSPLPIALDEELIGLNTPEQKRQMLDEVRPQYIVLKPSLHGGLSGAREWIDEAAERGIGHWITSALETNVGLNAIAQWTAALYPAGVPRHQGLGTGRLFTDNFHPAPLEIEGERLYFGHARTRRFTDEVRAFRQAWDDASPTLPVHTSGSTGTPKEIQVEKARMRASAEMTCRFLGLAPGDTALLCMPLDYIAGKMVAVRAFTHGLRLVCTAPSAHPFAGLRFSPTFAALTPMQVYETLRVPREATLLRGVRSLIIGGGAVDDALAARLRHFPHDVWSTYGMTETLSHVAMRRLSGPGAGLSYHVLPGVGVTLTSDGRLAIDAPAVCPHRLVTNDRARLTDDGGFVILGRADNVVCSGGIKMQIEELERRLAPLEGNFAVTAVPDPKFGEAVTLLYCGPLADSQLQALCRERLAPYEQPKHICRTDALPRTETGKPARSRIRALACRLCEG